MVVEREWMPHVPAEKFAQQGTQAAQVVGGPNPVGKEWFPLPEDQCRNRSPCIWLVECSVSGSCLPVSCLLLGRTEPWAQVWRISFLRLLTPTDWGNLWAGYENTKTGSCELPITCVFAPKQDWMLWAQTQSHVIFYLTSPSSRIVICWVESEGTYLSDRLPDPSFFTHQCRI
jgi:hypothetical protein